MKKMTIIGVTWMLLLTGCQGAAPAVKAETGKSGSFMEHGPRTKKQVALTFDADMTPKMKHGLETGKIPSLFDTRITDLLKKESIPATFFLTGMWAEIYPDAVKNFAANPLIEIGNHSYSHPGFKTPCYGLAKAENKQEEIEKTEEVLEKLTGKRPRYFRFPGGCYEKTDLKILEKEKMLAVGWDVISGDAYLKNPAAIEKQVISKTQNGSIIVMHLDGGPNSPATAAALSGIIQNLRTQGFEFVTVQELLK